MAHVETILRQMRGTLYRCDRYGHPIDGHPFGESDSFAKLYSGQREPIDSGMIEMHRGPYTVGLKHCREVTYIKWGDTYWVREGDYADFERTGFKIPTTVSTS